MWTTCLAAYAVSAFNMFRPPSIPDREELLVRFHKSEVTYPKNRRPHQAFTKREHHGLHSAVPIHSRDDIYHRVFGLLRQIKDAVGDVEGITWKLLLRVL